MIAPRRELLVALGVLPGTAEERAREAWPLVQKFLGPALRAQGFSLAPTFDGNSLEVRRQLVRLVGEILKGTCAP